MAAKFRIGRKLDDDEILEDNTYNTTTNIRKNGIENREDKHVCYFIIILFFFHIFNLHFVTNYQIISQILKLN